ncbi:MAG: hypothetical protein PHY26_01050 [Bacilli bacterium]|nr:hypothetical protein [Bacilli bacterium]
MFKVIAHVLKVIGTIIAASSTVGCVFLFWDESTAPNSILKK